jgi:hypothetical protein
MALDVKLCFIFGLRFMFWIYGSNNNKYDLILSFIIMFRLIVCKIQGYIYIRLLGSAMV